jgi:hypothetical protein
MEDMRRIAFECVARGVGFGSFAIAITMIGFSYDMLLSIKIGSGLCTLMAAILLVRGQFAAQTPYKRTELWFLLPVDRRPPESHAQWVSSTVIREAYQTFAYYVAVVAAVLGAMAILLRFIHPWTGA